MAAAEIQVQRDMFSYIPDHLTDRVVDVLSKDNTPRSREIAVELFLSRSRRLNASGIRTGMAEGVTLSVVAKLIGVCKPQASRILTKVVSEMGGHKIADGTYEFLADDEE